MLKETLRSIYISQQEWIIPDNKEIQRNQFSRFISLQPFCYILTGVRRSGKSTLLRQIMLNYNSKNYFNFEDTRTSGFELSDFHTLEELFNDLNGNSSMLFFDEIQNVPDWERYVRDATDRKKTIIITGSNAQMLSKELGTKLTGRHLDFEVYPFSYAEFSSYNNCQPSIECFKDYLNKGGFPEYLNIGNSELLSTLVNDILIRDIFSRYHLRNFEVYRKITQFLLSNTGKEISFNNLKNTFELGSANSVMDFLNYLIDSYLIFLVPRYDTSLKVQQRNPRKIYAIDSGMVNFCSVSGSPDQGRLLENVVYLHLKRNFKEIYYFKGKKECDFIYRNANKSLTAIQVSWVVSTLNQQREIDGLIEAMNQLKLNEGLILTFNQEDQLKVNGKIIQLIPAWKWLNEGV
jgi:uncharacterized protein